MNTAAVVGGNGLRRWDQFMRPTGHLPTPRPMLLPSQNIYSSTWKIRTKYCQIAWCRAIKSALPSRSANARLRLSELYNAGRRRLATGNAKAALAARRKRWGCATALGHCLTLCPPVCRVRLRHL
jgi:hypothetical protein